jgi:hypothetical protein
MSNEEKSEYKGIFRKELIGVAIALIVAGVGTWTAFYFNTNNALSELEKEMIELKADMKGKANADEMKEKIYNLHQDVRDLQTTNQKILEILLEREKK